MENDQELDVERIATGGVVGRLSDGRVAFVRYALPGERVSVRITKERSRFVNADAVAIERESADRVAAPCAYAHPEGCGGCDLQHVSPSAQLAWKASLVTEHFERIAHLDVDVVVEECGPAAGSRTRLRCAVDGNGRIGLRRHHSNEIQALAACYLADPRLMEAFAQDWRGAREVELRAIGHEAPFAVVTMNDGTVVTTDLDGLMDEEPRRSYVEVGNERFRVGPKSFWQSHVRAPEALTQTVMDMAHVRKGDHVVDLYSGVGLFTLPLARRVGNLGRVVSLESSKNSVADARRNLAGLDHARVVDVAVNPRTATQAVEPGSVVVLDPPRAGAGVDVMKAITKAEPRRIVYVSCDAATLARDVAAAAESGWRLTKMRTLDLFPMTEHSEVVVCLDKRP